MVISFDSNSGSAVIEAFTLIPHPCSDPVAVFSSSISHSHLSSIPLDTTYPSTFDSPLSRIYLSACDLPQDTAFPTLSQSYLTNITKPKTQIDRSDFTDIFLQTKKKYKPVALKTKPVLAELPSRFRINRKILGDPLADLPTILTNPPPFIPTGRYTAERRDNERLVLTRR